MRYAFRRLLCRRNGFGSQVSLPSMLMSSQTASDAQRFPARDHHQSHNPPLRDVPVLMFVSSLSIPSSQKNLIITSHTAQFIDNITHSAVSFPASCRQTLSISRLHRAPDWVSELNALLAAPRTTMVAPMRKMRLKQDPNSGIRLPRSLSE